ncbi:MAG: peroxiredoxin [Moraxellaceae bacterium]|nr:peroxiredoxin [Moraxellaceae bacterium]
MSRMIIALLSVLLSLPLSAIAAEWVGRPAPVLSLSDQDGKTRALADFKGRWVALYFYPKNNTPGCTQEALAFRDRHEELHRAGVAVIGVSADSVASHKDFARTHKLPFTLLADEQLALSRAMGVARGIGPVGFASRETFLIDPEGTIVYHYPSVNTAKHAGQVLEDVARLKASRP